MDRQQKIILTWGMMTVLSLLLKTTGTRLSDTQNKHSIHPAQVA